MLAGGEVSGPGPLPEEVEPVVPSGTEVQVDALISGRVDDVVSSEAGLFDGWVDGVAVEGVESEGLPGRRVGQRVGNSPVSVALDGVDVAVPGANGVNGGNQGNGGGNGNGAANGNRGEAANGNRGSAVSRALVNVLRPEHAQALSPFAAVATVGFEDAGGGEVVRSEPFELSFDLSDVAIGSGSAGVFGRLTVTRYENCEVFSPSEAALAGIEGTDIDPASLPGEVVCDVAEEVDAVFDFETRQLTAMIDMEELDAQVEATDEALVASGVPAANLDAKRGRERSAEVRNVNAITARGNSESRDLENPGLAIGRSRVAFSLPTAQLGVFAQAGGGTSGSTFAVTSGAASPSGDFSALPAPTLSDAQVGLFTGSAETSYPIPAPPAAAGPSPSVSFVYSSASVDGLTMGTNNQSGPLGVGWSLE